MAKFNIKTVKPKFVVATTPETKIDVSINRPIITAKNQKAYFKLKNTGGPKGEKGDPGTAATITVGSTSTGAPGTNASVTNSGTSSAAVLDFTIPRGDKGDKGDTGATGSPGAAATISVGTTTTGQPGTNASVTNVGTSSAAVLNFTIPKGAKGDTGATGAPGAPGSPGAAATVSVGTTTTGQPGTNASVTNSGTQSAAVLNFTIPKGDKGDNGNPGSAATIAVGTVTTLQPNQSAYVTNVGTSSAAVFDIGIPKGEQGQAGSGSGDMLAADYDPNGTVQNAGGIVAYVASEIPTKTSDLTNDGADNTSTYVEADELAAVATSGSYNDLLNKPTIPTVNNATLTIQKNGADVQTFTANQSTNATANITVPTKTSDLTNNGADNTSTYVEADELATVATSGNYSDLSGKPTIPAAQVNSDWNANSGVAEILNKPTIPTVNDATLTINQNGAQAGTFTANASSNTTISLTDTKYSDMVGATSGTAGASGLVPQPSAGDEAKVLSGAATWVAQPTVNDATLTIQQNGTSLGTFTANASSNATVDVNAPKLTSLVGSVQTSDYHRSVVALCEVASGSGSTVNSWSSGKLVAHRNNGAYGVAEIGINIEAKRSTAYYSNVSYFSNVALLSPTANIDTDLGFRPCTFKYNNVYYAGIEFYISSSSASNVYFSGVGNFDVFGLDYYSVAHGSTASSVLNSEVYNSLNYTQWNEERNQWRVGRATRDTIYSNSSGTNANFSTTSAMSNYDDVEITFRDGNSNYATRTVPGSSGSFVLDISHPGGSSTVYWYISRFIVGGTNITVGANNVRKAISTTISSTNSQDIYITKMVGIKY